MIPGESIHLWKGEGGRGGGVILFEKSVEKVFVRFDYMSHAAHFINHFVTQVCDFLDACFVTQIS